MRTFLAALFFSILCAVPGFASPLLSTPHDGISDTFIGNSLAPATLIVYSSPTCKYCIEFEEDILPQLNERYVETGKLRIAVRPFVRNSIDAVIFLVAEAAGPTKRDATVAMFMSRFQEIANGDNPEAVLRNIAVDAGIDRAAFDTAMNNGDFLARLNATTSRASTEFAVRGTPTFFLNGKVLSYDGTITSFAAEIDKLPN